jgi:hypothetical protein
MTLKLRKSRIKYKISSENILARIENSHHAHMELVRMEKLYEVIN